MKLQRPHIALLLAFAATIFVSSVYAQEEVLPAKPQEEVKPSLRSVTFDEFSSVAAEEPQTILPAEDKKSTDRSDPFANFRSVAEAPKASTETQFVGDVKWDQTGLVRFLGVGQAFEVKPVQPIEGIEVTATEVLDVRLMNSKQNIFVKGKAVGSAILTINFKDKSSETHRFQVKSESDSFESILKQLFPKHKLEIVPIRDTAVFIRGTVETEAEVQQIEEIAGEFWPTVHNHIQAPRNEPVYAEDRGQNAIPDIPKGMQPVAVQIIGWTQNPNSPQFNQIVSLYSTELMSNSRRPRETVMGKGKLIGDNLQAFTRSSASPRQVSDIALLVTEQQLTLINQAEQQGLRFFLVSQVVNQSRPVGLTTQLNPKDSFLLTDSNRPSTPPPSNPVPSNLYVPTPVAPPLYQGEPQRLQPSTPPAKGPSDSSQVPTYVDPSTPLQPYDPLQQPPAEFKNVPPTKRQQIVDPDPSSELPPFQNSATPAPTNSLQGDVRALHSDVKKLIELLEKRQAKQEKKPAKMQSTQLIPKEGKAVLFFHASWAGEPCKKMKPIVQKLQAEGLIIVSVDINEHPEVSKRYNIKSIPTFQQIEDAVPLRQISGATTEERLREFVQESEEPEPTDAKSVFSFLSNPLKSDIQIVVGLIVQNTGVEVRPDVVRRPEFGSGVLVQHEKGKVTILTAARLFRNAKLGSELPILLSMSVMETTYQIPKNAKLVAADSDADLALIEISLPELPFKLKPARLSTNALKNEDDVFIVSYGFGIATVSNRTGLLRTGGLVRRDGQITSVYDSAETAKFDINKSFSLPGLNGTPVFDKTGGFCGMMLGLSSAKTGMTCLGLKKIKRFLKAANIELPEERLVSFYTGVTR